MAENEKGAGKGKTIAGVGLATATATALALIASRGAKAAPPQNGGGGGGGGGGSTPSEQIDYVVSLDTAALQLLITIAQATEITRETIIEKGIAVPNADSITATRVRIAALNTPYQLPDIEVPDDMFLQLKGWPTNAGMILVGTSRGTCVNQNQSWPLLANEAVGYRIKNANVLYVSGTAVGDFCAITVEQRR